MTLQVGDKVINHCDCDWVGVITAVHPSDPDCYLFDDIDYYHEAWLERVEEEQNG